MNSDRITVRPEVMLGKPVITGTRIPVQQIQDELNGGWSYETILDAHPRLTLDDIRAVIAYYNDAASE